MVSDHIVNEYAYECRNSQVVLRIVRVRQLGKIAISESSLESIRFQVHAVGPKVEGLKVGDWVMAAGQVKVDYDFVIGEKNLVVMDEKIVALKVLSKNAPEDAIYCKNCGEWYASDTKRKDCMMCSSGLVLKG